MGCVIFTHSLTRFPWNWNGFGGDGDGDGDGRIVLHVYIVFMFRSKIPRTGSVRSCCEKYL